MLYGNGTPGKTKRIFWVIFSCVLFLLIAVGGYIVFSPQEYAYDGNVPCGDFDAPGCPNPNPPLTGIQEINTGSKQ